jgi:hypothetical protein
VHEPPEDDRLRVGARDRVRHDGVDVVADHSRGRASTRCRRPTSSTCRCCGPARRSGLRGGRARSTRRRSSRRTPERAPIGSRRGCASRRPEVVGLVAGGHDRDLVVVRSPRTTSGPGPQGPGPVHDAPSRIADPRALRRAMWKRLRRAGCRRTRSSRRSRPRRFRR